MATGQARGQDGWILANFASLGMFMGEKQSRSIIV